MIFQIGTGNGTVNGLPSESNVTGGVMMELTKHDLQLIAQAERSISQSRFVTLGLVVLLLIGMAAFFLALIQPTTFGIVCVGLTAYAIFFPRLSGPNYTEMVELLVKIKSQASSAQHDPIVDALSGK